EELRLKSESENVPIIHKDVENFLKLLIKMKRMDSVLEIGAAVGYSALMFSEVVPNGKITTIERYEKMFNIANENIYKFGRKEQIEIIFGNATDILKNDIKCKYDLVFIDAAKSHYREFFELSLEHLNEGGVIVSDNVLFKGRVVNDKYVERRNKTITRNMRNYLEFINQSPYFTTILPIGDGLSITMIEEK
ncbi:MAG: O-methyltransferase, partial [Bacillota bacterium]|nr:O-methyltransferase [Bacillota bacterium]